MSVYQVALHKVNSALTSRPFTNVYHVNASSVAQALTFAVDLVTIESQLFSDTTQFYEVSAFIPHARGSGGRLGVTTNGARAAVGAILPPWNVVRVDFQSALNSHIVRKYLRIGLGEGDVVGAALEAAIYTLLGNYYSAIVNSSQAVMPDGTSLSTSGGGPDGGIAMRQPEHHRIHKKGFKRGWVPV